MKKAYLPKINIPIEKRKIGDSGWLLTCRGQNRNDPLQLSSVQLKRDNIVCRIFGSTNLFDPLEVNIVSKTETNETDSFPNPEHAIQKSILDNIYELLSNARKHECWEEGYGGVGVVNISSCFYSNFLADISN